MDVSYIDQLTAYLHTHPHTAYVVTFIIAFAESIAIIGTVVPGSVTMTAIGALIGAGVIPATPTLICALLGAVLGDFFSYWLGAHYNDRLRSIWPLKKNPRWLKMGEDFFEKHGGKSVLLGRFFGPVRSVVPLIAGMMRMSTSRFVIAAIPSATIWVCLYIVPGILVGAFALELPRDVATKFMLLVLCIIAFGWLVIVSIRVFFRKGLEAIDRFIEKIWTTLFALPRMAGLFDFFNYPHQVHPHRQLTRLIAALGCLLLFVLLWLNVFFHFMLTSFNDTVFLLSQCFRYPQLDNIALVISLMGDKKILLPAVLLIGLWLFWRRQAKTALIWLGTIGAGTVTTYLVKYVYFSPRPPGCFGVSTESSFPSGHAMLAMMTYGLLAFLLASHTRSPTRCSFIYTLAGIVIGLVGLSRLYLGVHWFTDVIAGMLFGLVFVLLGALMYLRRPVTQLPPAKFAGVSLGAILCVGVAYGGMYFSAF